MAMTQIDRRTSNKMWFE
jgi:hypothetical protein